MVIQYCVEGPDKQGCTGREGSLHVVPGGSLASARLAKEPSPNPLPPSREQATETGEDVSQSATRPCRFSRPEKEPLLGGGVASVDRCLAQPGPLRRLVGG